MRWSLGNCVGDLPRWVFLRRWVPEDCRIDRSDTDGTDNGGATYFFYLKFSRRRMTFVSIKWQNFETVPLISAKKQKQFAITICSRMQCTHFTFYLENIWQALFYFVRNVDLGGQWMYFHLMIEKTMVLSFLVPGHPRIFVTKCLETCKNSPIWRICAPVSYMASKM